LHIPIYLSSLQGRFKNCGLKRFFNVAATPFFGLNLNNSKPSLSDEVFGAFPWRPSGSKRQKAIRCSGRLVPRNLRGTATGCLQFFMFLMQAILQVAVGVISVYVSPQLPFLLLAVTMLPLSLFVFWCVHEPKIREA
jgi:hypothetical protein